MASKISESSREDPFQVLIGTLLSARTQDATTAAASARLFVKARTPAAMATLTERQIEKLIYPVSFYRYKARHVRQTCRMLVERFDGRVPQTMEELLTLPGVGRKTANLVLILAFKSAKNICVDTHVHRISRRLELTTQNDPAKIEQDLVRVIPQEKWILFSHQIIWHGRSLCPARNPKCADSPL